MCCGKGAGCDGIRGHVLIGRQPADLRAELHSQRPSLDPERGPAPETRAAVGVQTMEQPWIFARTYRKEGRGDQEDNDGRRDLLPRFDARDRLDRMQPWLESGPTVVRVRPAGDDGLGSHPACR